VVGTVRVVVALVMPDLTVRPVPLHALRLTATADTSHAHELRTGLDGSGAAGIPAGAYRVRSVQPVTLGDSAYAWDVPLEVTPAGVSLELTNANATVTAAARGMVRQVAPEREVFERVKRGVFRVEAGLGHGSGFLADTLGGLVITNDHVVGTADAVSVYVDSITRLPAQIVARDRDADLAVLRISLARCADCPRLTLATPEPNQPLVVAGERLLAIGFPLSQELTVTSGIASSIRDGAIISDVNINPGNSGGPMLNMAGQVVAVNTFGEAAGTVGPGVSGSITVHRLGALLARARESLATLPAPEDRPLPAMPRDRYPLALIKQIADTAKISAYRHISERSAGKFTVFIGTPTQQLVLMKQEEEQVAKDRRNREKRAGVADEQRFSELAQVRDWMEYVGDVTAPVIAIQVIPKIGETFGSSLMRGLAMGAAGVMTKAKLKFQGDVRGVKLYRNGVEIEALRGGHAPQKVLVENQWVALKDVADMGYYVYPPEAFMPDSTGAPARVSVIIQDLKNPGSLSSVDIWGETSARVWNDFALFYTTVRPSSPFVAADPSQPSPKVPLTCDARTGACTSKNSS
jgi:hypothetical protein